MFHLPRSGNRHSTSMVAGMAAPASNYGLQTMLQSAVQSVNWTYSLFWQLCPQQRILVWGEGYYNGPIKTRKTVQPMEVSTEEASLHRSEQLRELYDSLSAGETNQPARRPSAALSPEDLTESEWFYLMCVSFSFPPGVGLPGKAYAKQKHLWLIGACEVDSKVFARAILAKSAHIQTVVCIPLLDGVVELGTTEKVPEDIGLVQRVKSFFIEHNVSIPPKPALSGHSTSNTAMSPTLLPTCTLNDPLSNATDRMDEDEDEDEDEEDDEEEDGDDNEEIGDDEEVESDTEADTDTGSRLIQGLGNGIGHDHVVAEPSELMHFDLSEDIRLGSPEDDSNNLDSDFDHLLGASQVGAMPGNGQAGRVDSYRAESSHKWPALDCCDDKPFNYCSLQLQESGAPPLEELAIEDTHYSTTVSTILHHQSNLLSDSSSAVYSLHSTQSAFANWTPIPPLHGPTESIISQCLLKYTLITVPLLHTNSKTRDGSAAESVTRFRKGTLQDELSANHVMAERRRREKLNERFIILRSLVPFVTKMDKASILGDTIEYLKQLRKKIQDLEARATQPEMDLTSPEKRKMRVAEGGSAGKPRKSVAAGEAVQVEVSIIENDALVEIRCPCMEGLLLDVMQVLRELRVEITAVQSSLNGGVFVAEMRAKVKENVNGKKVSIMEVKRAINQIIPHN